MIMPKFRVVVPSLLAVCSVLVIYIISNKIKIQAHCKLAEMYSQRERILLESKETTSTLRPGSKAKTGRYNGSVNHIQGRSWLNWFDQK